MLPDSDNDPSSFPQQPAGLFVAGQISLDLLLPVHSIRRWRRKVAWAPVPETSINEYRDLRSTKDYVSPPINVAAWPLVDSVTEAMGVKNFPQGEFRSGVATSVPLHHFSSGGARCPRVAVVLVFVIHLRSRLHIGYYRCRQSCNSSIDRGPPK